MKAIEKDGKLFRLRRGKLVEIPPEWAGKVVHGQTKRKRASNQSSAQRHQPRNFLKDGSCDWSNWRERRHDYELNMNDIRDDNFDIDSFYKRSARWEKLRAQSYLAIVLDCRKWTYRQFYPDKP